MKKCAALLLALALCISSFLITTTFANYEIKVSIDGKYIDFDVPPQMINDRTMVPLRAIFEALDAEVSWDDPTQTVTATKDDIVVIATIGSYTMKINNTKKEMDIAPMLVDERTLVPARFVAEAFDCDVLWSEEENTVYIRTSNPVMDQNDDVGQE